MNIMIFAAGMGTRLKPITDTIPKALVPVQGKPLLQHVIERVDGEGNTIVINIHHHADQIRNFIDTTRHHWRSNIILSDESDNLLDTGGGIRKAAALFPNDEPILIHNVDILSNVDLHQFYNTWHTAPGTAAGHSNQSLQGGQREGLLLVSDRDTQRYLIFDDDMCLVGWTNIKTGEVKSPYPEVHQAFDKDYIATEVPYSFIDFNRRPKLYELYAFSGIHIITQQLILAMDSWPDKFSIMDFYLANCKQYDIRGVIQDNLHLLDVGKLDTLDKAGEFIKTL